MVRSLGTIHHHHYLHQFSWTLTTGSAWLGREFEFLEKRCKSQTGLFRALISRCGRRQAPTGALTQPASPQDALHPHLPACFSSAEPVAPVLGLSVQPDMSTSESLAGLGPLPSPSQPCWQQQQGKGD